MIHDQARRRRGGGGITGRPYYWKLVYWISLGPHSKILAWLRPPPHSKIRGDAPVYDCCQQTCVRFRISRITWFRGIESILHQVQASGYACTWWNRFGFRFQWIFYRENWFQVRFLGTLRVALHPHQLVSLPTFSHVSVIIVLKDRQNFHLWLGRIGICFITTVNGNGKIFGLPAVLLATAVQNDSSTSLRHRRKLPHMNTTAACCWRYTIHIWRNTYNDILSNNRWWQSFFQWKDNNIIFSDVIHTFKQSKLTRAPLFVSSFAKCWRADAISRQQQQQWRAGVWRHTRPSSPHSFPPPPNWSALIGWYVSTAVASSGEPDSRSRERPNLFNGGIHNDRAHVKHCLLHSPWPLPSHREIPGNQQNLELKA